MRQQFTIREKLADGKVRAESERGEVIEILPDPVNDGWAVGDLLDALVAPADKRLFPGGGAGIRPPLGGIKPPLPGRDR